MMWTEIILLTEMESGWEEKQISHKMHADAFQMCVCSFQYTI